MVIPFSPAVTGFKVENVWGRGRARGRVRCTVRFSRLLTREESERIGRFLKVAVGGGEIVYECRPEEVEEWHGRLADVLAGRRPPRERRAAAAAEQRVRHGRPGAVRPPRRPEPAA